MRDARAIGSSLLASGPPFRPLPDEATQPFAALVARRRQLIEMLVAEKNRVGFASPAIQKGIKKHVSCPIFRSSHAIIAS